MFRALTFAEALERARARSTEFRCSVYVAAILETPRDGEPRSAGYIITDWSDASCVARFDDGVRSDP